MPALLATRDYQKSMVALRALTYRDVTKFWPMLDMDHLDDSFPKFAASVAHLIMARRIVAAALARDYLAKVRATAGAVDPLSDVPVTDVPVAVYMAALRIASVISVKAAMTRREPIQLASRRALVRSMGVADKFIGDAGRDWIRDAVAADPAARGWRRRTLGTCAFCAELAAEEHVHSGDADFPRHDHCGCQPEPVFRGSEPQFLAFTPGAVNEGFTAAEQRALIEYQRNAFHEINAALRGQENATAATKALISEMDAVLSRSALDVDSVVFRGLQERIEGLTVGSEFTDSAFLSSSLDEDFVAGMFADPEVVTEAGDFVESVVIRMDVPKGTHALRIDSDNPFYAREKEVLLARGAKFRIVREQPGVPGQSPTILWAVLVP